MSVSSENEKSLRKFVRIRLGYDILVVPKIILAELCYQLMRRNVPEKYDAILIKLKPLYNVRIIDLDEDIIKMAAKIKHSTGVYLVDSIIAATALVNNCSEILSKDKDYKTIAEKFRIRVNAAI